MAVGLQKGGGGAKRRGRRRGGLRGAPMGEINITPFVDVMLVLLIIFMVAAPLLTVGVPVQLPESKANPLPRETAPPLAVTVDAEGRVYLEEEELSLEALPARMAAAIEDPETDRVYVRADQSTDYGLVVRVMAALNAGGFRNIGLVTNAEPRSAAESGG